MHEKGAGVMTWTYIDRSIYTGLGPGEETGTIRIINPFQDV